jgi:putative Mg2+ transporter-C (MgtC) family protein
MNTEILIKLAAAVLVGGLIGAEREFRDKAAGFRTIIFIAVGSTLFTIFSSLLSGQDNDPARIAANIVTGIGFLGAGTIMRDGGRVAGLTTAATIWLTAALGMGIGGGQYLMVAMATITVLLVLWIFPRIELWIDNVREVRTYRAHFALGSEKGQKIEALFQGLKMRIFECHMVKTKNEMVCTWTVQGSPKNQDTFVKMMLADVEIQEFNY